MILGILFILLFGENYPQNSKLFCLVDSITKFVSRDDFASLDISDSEKTDSIYCYALKVSGNESDALLGLTIALVPHNKIPLTVPIIGYKIDVPFLSSAEEYFDKKNKNLPKRLFLDGPKNQYGDQDKLAHFFGSAFLSYNLRVLDYSLLIGYFVESFEETFGISRIDMRDMRANALGAEFGKLIRTKKIMPSQMFLIYNLKYFIL